MERDVEYGEEDMVISVTPPPNEAPEITPYAQSQATTETSRFTSGPVRDESQIDKKITINQPPDSLKEATPVLERSYQTLLEHMKNSIESLHLYMDKNQEVTARFELAKHENIEHSFKAPEDRDNEYLKAELGPFSLNNHHRQLSYFLLKFSEMPKNLSVRLLTIENSEFSALEQVILEAMSDKRWSVQEFQYLVCQPLDESAQIYRLLRTFRPREFTLHTSFGCGDETEASRRRSTPRSSRSSTRGKKPMLDDGHVHVHVHRHMTSRLAEDACAKLVREESSRDVVVRAAGLGSFWGRSVLRTVHHIREFVSILFAAFKSEKIRLEKLSITFASREDVCQTLSTEKSPSENEPDLDETLVCLLDPSIGLLCGWTPLEPQFRLANSFRQMVMPIDDNLLDHAILPIDIFRCHFPINITPLAVNNIIKGWLRGKVAINEIRVSTSYDFEERIEITLNWEKDDPKFLKLRKPEKNGVRSTLYLRRNRPRLLYIKVHNSKLS
ncbi:unnamed protein product [Caenorhabditis auriculariae]|uniref:Uncharacterized protein n=1 Tax=Caenorhabditis auriculariae TaxID=2777116 RepID=A0A8S1HP30_9PELO|nr:unnamed protein product [Caenorhabditis auriculariae]